MLFAGIVLAAALVFLFISTPVAHAALTLTAGSNATTTPNVATSITGFQIVGPAASTTPVKLRATSGTLNLSAVDGVTMSGNGSGTVNLSGVVEKLNTALATLTYTRASTGTDTLEVSLVEAGEVFFEDNGHLYQYISDAGTWTEARAKAELLTRYGVTGYLVTVTSANENAFVTARLSNAGWMGASDSVSEGVWRWVTGPEGETNTQFWSGAAGGNTVDGNYANWNTGEPNDSGSNEDCGQFLAGATGKWNDLPCSGNSLPGYVAEFGAPGALPTVVAQNISIVTADVPALTALSPTNGANLVSPSADLVLTFSKAVTKQTGNILIRQAADDEIVATIDVASDLVTGAASTTVTINPENTLGDGVQYYVTVPSTAFSDSSDNFFSGITDDSTWVFTTSDENAPSITTVSATPATTTAAIAWNTNEAASSKVVYGLTAAYGTTTAETDTSPRVTAHEVTLSALLSCATYHYEVVSRDASGNSATSTPATFLTSGCTYDETPTAATSTTITSNTGGATSVTSNNKTFRVTAPADATDTAASFVIQVNAVPSAGILATLGRPSAKPSEVGVTVFDVTAIIDGDTVLDSFDAEVTIEYEYTDEEILGLTEDSLWLYHYTGGQWVALNDCSLNVQTNTISCTTPSFSIFGLFGNEVVPEGISGTHFGCKDSAATNYDRFTAHRQELCVYDRTDSTENTISQDIINLVLQHRDVFLQAYQSGFDLPQYLLDILGVTVADGSVRDLELGMEGEDIRQLQQLLIAQDSGLLARELARIGDTGYFGTYTQNALGEYQQLNGIVPWAGYFGAITRTQMKGAELDGLWW